MTERNNLTAELVRELFHYDTETGDLIWKAPRSNCIKPGMKAANLDSRGYLRVVIGKHQYRVHRVVWLYVHGCWPNGHLDHLNRIRTDNRICNLRECNDQLNLANRTVTKRNRLGVKGVMRVNGSRFVAQITFNYKNIHLGTFDTIEEASAAYKSAAEQYFGTFSQA